MAITSTLYNMVFKRTSTFVLFITASTFFFERTFDLVADGIFDTVNKGKLYKDLTFTKPEEE